MVVQALSEILLRKSCNDVNVIMKCWRIGRRMFDLRLHIQIQIVFFKVLASSFLSFGKTVKWSRFKLFQGHTFRVTGANAEGDYLAALRYAKRSLTLIWMQREKGLRLDSVTFYWAIFPMAYIVIPCRWDCLLFGRF